jgi:hypothetical protein
MNTPRSLAFSLALVTLATVLGAPPLRLHPKNPRYLEWRGRPVVIVSAGEHYGAVLNADFDWRRYLATLEADGMNYTRLFTGSYREKPGAFGIQRNTLAPEPGRFRAPWARSGQPGAGDGGNRFDLGRWDDAYWARLRDFVGEAGRRGIVVEVTLFSSIYGEEQWSVNPLNPTNNTAGLPPVDFHQVHTPDNAGRLPHQEALVRKGVRELNRYDNVVFEIQNEPWADQHTMGDFINPYLTKEHRWPNAVEVVTPASLAWQAQVAGWIASEETTLPQRHLIAQNVANFRLALRGADFAPEVSILNFHYAYPEAVTWNPGLGRVLGYDETGFLGGDDRSYRRQAWNFLLAGGGLFNHLDYSFTVGREDGTDTAPNGPGGGSPALRRQLRILRDFLETFDLARLAPDARVVRKAPGVVTQVLSVPGREYALYLEGRDPVTLELDLPTGRWQADWISVVTGAVLRQQNLRAAGSTVLLESPPFDGEVALRVRR